MVLMLLGSAQLVVRAEPRRLWWDPWSSIVPDDVCWENVVQSVDPITSGSRNKDSGLLVNTIFYSRDMGWYIYGYKQWVNALGKRRALSVERVNDERRSEDQTGSDCKHWTIK